MLLQRQVPADIYERSERLEFAGAHDARLDERRPTAAFLRDEVRAWRCRTPMSTRVPRVPARREVMRIPIFVLATSGGELKAGRRRTATR